MRNGLSAFFIHFFVTVFFVIVALAYFHPVLQGKVIEQSDIVQFTGMAKEQNDFRKKTGEEPYWTNGAFGGMPTYQLGAYYPHDYVKKLDRIIRFLPRPADYLFIYLIKDARHSPNALRTVSFSSASSVILILDGLFHQ